MVSKLPTKSLVFKLEFRILLVEQANPRLAVDWKMRLLTDSSSSGRPLNKRQTLSDKQAFLAQLPHGSVTISPWKLVDQNLTQFDALYMRSFFNCRGCIGLHNPMHSLASRAVIHHRSSSNWCNVSPLFPMDSWKMLQLILLNSSAFHSKNWLDLYRRLQRYGFFFPIQNLSI